MTRASTPPKRRPRPSRAERPLNPARRVPREVWVGALLITVAALIAYIPAMRAGYIWDDADHVSKLAFAGTWSYLKWIWIRPGATPQYYPLTHTTFWIEYHLWGLRPAGYHIVNVLLHIANSLLLWRILRRLGVPGAWLAAAVFALHPVHVESVAWVSERKNTLSGLFYLLSGSLALTVWEICPLRKSGGQTTPETEVVARRRAYLLCLLCYLAAVLSKTVTATLPAAVLLMVYWKKGRISLRDVLKTLPFFVVAVCMARLTSTMERTVVGAAGPAFDWSFTQRVLIAGRVLCFYVGKLAWPTHLVFMYRKWTINPHVPWQWAFPLAAAAVVGILWFMRSRIGRGPLIAVLFFAGTLFPALGFINVYPMRFSFVADHFQYLASIGLITLGATLLWRSRSTRRRAVVAAVVLLPLATLTFLRARTFKDEETVWYDTLEKNPTCWLAMGNLAEVAARHGRDDEALAWYDKSLAAFPRQPEALLRRGQLLADEHHWDEAIRSINSALACDPTSLRLRYGVVSTRAGVLAKRGDLAGAVRDYQAALAIQPGREETRLAYCVLLRKLNRPQEAIENYEKALELNPDSVAVRSSLADMLARAGYLQEAMRYTAEAIELKPDPRLENNYGVMLIQTGHADEAAAQFSRAISTDPGFADAYDGLGFAREAQGRYSEAEALYRKAIELNPDFKIAQNHLSHLRGRIR